MAPSRPHAYHLPSEGELAQTQLIIAQRQDHIALIDRSIENERANLDTKISQLEAAYAPSIEKIRGRIEREEAKIAVLEKQRAAEERELRETTTKKIENWEQRRMELDKEIRNDKGFIAPIRRLPSELLSEIFIHFRNPWPLTKVCRSWRTVALRTPRLWGYIFITGTRSPTEPSHSQLYSYTRTGPRLKTAPSEENGREYAQRCMTVKGLETALNLAGRTPLHVTISIANRHSSFEDFEDYYQYEDSYLDSDYDPFIDYNQQRIEERKTEKQRIEKQWIEVLQLLTQHFPRIQSLIVINLPDLAKPSEFGGRFTSVFKGKLTLLVELEVNMHNALAKALMASAQATCRNLKSLTYTQPSKILDPEINVKLNREILSGLTSLRLGSGILPFEEALWDSMVQLREVEFASRNLNSWSALLLPKLQRLTISGGMGTDLGGHLPRLKYLALHGITLNAGAFSISAPALEVLVVSGRLESARIIEAPNLEFLGIQSTSLKKTDANTLVAMLWDNTGTAQGRCLNPRKLRVDVDTNDITLARAVKLMDRIEHLEVGVRAKMNCRKKFLADLASKGKKGAIRADLPSLCPNLKRLEVFPGQGTYSEISISGPGDRLQIQNLLDGINAARPGVECVLKG